MYYWKFNEEETLKILNGKTKGELAEEIGVTKTCMSYVFTRKRHCPKTLAYIITKMLDSEKEISDYFEKK